MKTTARHTTAALVAPAVADRLLEKVRLEDADPEILIPYARELRLHSTKQLDKLEASMRAFGNVDPILVGDDNEIIDGSARVAVAKRLGLKSVQILRVGHLNREERRLLRVALWTCTGFAPVTYLIMPPWLRRRAG